MRLFSFITMILFYVAAGINHFWHPGTYKRIMPHIIPSSFHLPLVYISGICEIAFALLLVPHSTRRLAAWLIIALLIAIFPANIQMAVDFHRRHSTSTWLAMLRLPLQLLLIAWAWQFTRRS